MYTMYAVNLKALIVSYICLIDTQYKIDRPARILIFKKHWHLCNLKTKGDLCKLCALCIEPRNHATTFKNFKKEK